MSETATTFSQRAEAAARARQLRDDEAKAQRRADRERERSPSAPKPLPRPGLREYPERGTVEERVRWLGDITAMDLLRSDRSPRAISNANFDKFGAIRGRDNSALYAQFRACGFSFSYGYGTRVLLVTTHDDATKTGDDCPDIQDPEFTLENHNKAWAIWKAARIEHYTKIIGDKVLDAITDDRAGVMIFACDDGDRDFVADINAYFAANSFMFNGAESVVVVRYQFQSTASGCGVHSPSGLFFEASLYRKVAGAAVAADEARLAERFKANRTDIRH